MILCYIKSIILRETNVIFTFTETSEQEQGDLGKKKKENSRMVTAPLKNQLQRAHGTVEGTHH